MKLELLDNKVYFEKEGLKKEIHPFWLRERVSGEDFVDKSTQQRLFDPTKLNSKEDFLTPWLKFILNFFGIEEVKVISADQMALDYDKSIREAEKQIEDIT